MAGVSMFVLSTLFLRPKTMTIIEERDYELPTDKFLRLFDPSNDEHYIWFMNLSKEYGKINNFYINNPMDIDISLYDYLTIYERLSSKYIRQLSLESDDEN
jgi:hypothetical protein